MKIYLKAITDLTAAQSEAVDKILGCFGVDDVLVVEYVEDSETGKSITVVPCVKTGETLRFTLDRPQSQGEIETLIPQKLLKLLLDDSEGAYVDKEYIDSVDNLFKIVKVV